MIWKVERFPPAKIVNLLECGTSGTPWPFKIFIFYLSRGSQKSLVTDRAGSTLKLQRKVPPGRIPSKELVPLKIESAGLTTALSYSREFLTTERKKVAIEAKAQTMIIGVETVRGNSCAASLSPSLGHMA